MRFTIKNTSKALQGVHTVADGLVFIEPGHQRTLDVHEDHAERTQRSTLLSVTDAPALKADSEGDQEQIAPALDTHTIAELRAIAEAEQVDLGDATRKADIIAAIEAKRAAA